jgi:hypothetical protein
MKMKLMSWSWFAVVYTFPETETPRSKKSLSVSLLNNRRSSHRPSLMSFFSILRLVFFSQFCFDAFSPHSKKGASVGVERARVNAEKTARATKIKRVGRRRAKEAEKSMTWVMSVSGTVAGSPPMMRWCLE